MRKFLRAIGFVVLLPALLLVVVGYTFTYRYPKLSFDPAPLSTQLKLESVSISANGAYAKESSTELFRAYQPDVSFEVKGYIEQAMNFSVENIHPDAQLEISPNSVEVTEQINGLKRSFTINSDQGEQISLNLNFPKKTQYRLGVVGDTGGDTELSWGLLRLAQHEVDFILHLGDGYYRPAEVGQVQKRFNQSTVPVYATNGNHDFHGPNGLTIDTYLRNIGPLNNAFRLLNTCFINLETGGFMFPPHKGNRGQFLRTQIEALTTVDRGCKPVIFTHKPIMANLNIDIPQVDHTLHGYDSKWIIEQLQKLKNPLVLAGHIHKDFEFQQKGVRTIVTGSGLAQDDLIKQEFVAKLLLIEISETAPLRTQWVLNEMPLGYHCSAKVRASLLKKSNTKKKPQTRLRYAELVKQLDSACGR